MSEVEIVENISLKKKEYSVIIGLAGTTVVGNTALMYIARTKRFKKIAHLKSWHIPPMMILADGEAFPPFRIYIDETSDVLLVITESPISAEGSYPVAASLFKWLLEKGMKELYCVEVLPVGGLSSNVKALSYSNKIDLTKYGIIQAREGAIAGIPACLMEECLKRDIPFATIFIPITRLVAMDYGATASVVEVLNLIFKFGVDSSPLRQTDEGIKKALDQQQQQQQKGGIGRVLNRR